MRLFKTKNSKVERNSRSSVNFFESVSDFEEPSSTSSDDKVNSQLIDLLRERIEYEPYIPNMIPTTPTASEDDPNPSIHAILEDDKDEIKIIMVRNSEENRKRKSSKKTTDEKRKVDELLKKKAKNDGDTKGGVIEKIKNSELDYLYDLIILKEHFFDLIAERKILPKETNFQMFSSYNKILDLHYSIGVELGNGSNESVIEVYYSNVEAFSQLYLNLFVKYNEIVKLWQQQIHCNQQLREFVEEEEKDRKCLVEDLFRIPFKHIENCRELFNKLSNWAEKEEMSDLQGIISIIRSLQEQKEIFCNI